MTDRHKPFDILLVEDEPGDAHLVRMALKTNKVLCNLYHVSDGLEALDFLYHRSQTYPGAPMPDLILLDLNMPRMNGKEFLATIKEDQILAAIPVIVLTTSDIEPDIVASYKSGAAGYITKPVDIMQFIEAMSQFNNYWLSLVRLPKKD